MRLMVIGSAGLLGHYVVEAASSLGHDTVAGYSSTVPTAGDERVRLDLTDAAGTMESIISASPDAVVLTAAMTHVDHCEREPNAARAVNAGGPEAVAEACAKLGVRLVYVSTDYVFDGTKGSAYTEEDAPAPLSAYGHSKLEGEQAVMAASNDNLVARVSVVYGWSRASSKGNFVTWVIDSLRQGRHIDLFADQRVSPTYAPHCAEVLLAMLDRCPGGVYHASGPNCLDRVTMGMDIADAFELDKELMGAVPTSSVDLPAARPPMSCLDVSHLVRTIDKPMLGFRDGLMRMRQEEGVQ